MSYIPSSVMKHAGPLHHDEHPPQTSDGEGRHRHGGLGAGAWLAIGGTILASAAAIAVPLIRGGKAKAANRSASKATRKRKKAPAAKAA
ncbi:hypothetical protein [Sphingomonas sp. MA1305]|uniref:hypothetical protein n=1 Tax=Sphingomonas sp. MA1305 TaxID=2479204 RepID=UPI0018DEF5A9|nr:hypothetical protein [Sphingomonas sp. MA1305]